MNKIIFFLPLFLFPLLALAQQSSYSFTDHQLKIPAVNVQETDSFFDVELQQLLDISPLTFELSAINNSVNTITPAALFKPTESQVRLPYIKADNLYYQATLNLIPNSNPLRFTVSDLSQVNSQEPLKIGGLFPFSGIGAEFFSKQPFNGASLATKQLNEAGFSVQLLSADSVANPFGATEALKATEKFVNEENIQVLLGGIISNETLAIAKEIAIPRRILQIAYNSPYSEPFTTQQDQDFLFRTGLSYVPHGAALAQAIFNRGYRKVAVFFLDDIDHGGVSRIFQKAFIGLGGGVVNTYAHPLVPQTTYMTELNEAKMAGAEALVAFSFPIHYRVYMKESLNNKVINVFFGVSTTQSDDIINSALETESLPEGSCISAPVLNRLPAWQSFNEAYLVEYGEKALQLSGENAYDGVITATLASYIAKIRGEPITAISIRNHLREVANPPGVEIMGGVEQLKKAKDLLTEGRSINYTGASGTVDYNNEGDVLGPIGLICSEQGKATVNEIFSIDELDILLSELGFAQ